MDSTNRRAQEASEMFDDPRFALRAPLTMPQQRLATAVIDIVRTDPEFVRFCASAGGGKTFLWRWLEEFLRDASNYGAVEPSPPEPNPHLHTWKTFSGEQPEDRQADCQRHFADGNATK